MQETPIALLPLAPKNPLSYRQRARALRSFHTGMDHLRDAGGPVTRLTFGPKWLTPPVVVATSPEAIRDILTNKDGSIDKTTRVFSEFRRVLGANLFDLPHEAWLPRRRTLQPVFTKQQVAAFGGHMTEAAESVAAAWHDGATVNLDTECRTLTLRALGRSVLGLDLTNHAVDVGEPLRVALTYIAERAVRPVRAPAWLPTPARWRARTAAATLRGLAGAILQACRTDPGRDAPLVRALMQATDPVTGQRLTDQQIADELIVFLFAGHDTTATTLAYALWQLGRHADIQDRVAAEVARLPDRKLTPDDVGALPYTVQVLHEALRLCPPTATGSRMAIRDVEVAGYRVQAGTMLLFGRRAVQRDPALWEEPLVFDPDRFSPANTKGRVRWQYVPFGAGPRSCIGDHFAMLEATLGLATFIRRAEVHSLVNDFPLAAPLTVVAGGPIWARIRRRSMGTTWEPHK
ncbi:cytochrome P450 [Mycobacterium decipiens]|uniref:Cytochrome P450 n=1 Tax=Mycobacterium decipiens TaxID=1430326 RepID=A0A1X2LVL7_9MYCO|nr:cytochrome P450 [Mycobacterium decipiens]OSC41147.1 cytochrome P450 [Mycobacterium decipiens]